MMILNTNNSKKIDFETTVERFNDLLNGGYLASALNLADEAITVTINTPLQTFWNINKGNVFLMSGDYQKMNMCVNMAQFSARQFNDERSEIMLAELMILFPLSYTDLESKIDTLTHLNPNSSTLEIARITLSGRETGKTFNEMLKMYICSQLSESMSRDQKAILTCQWGFMTCNSQELELSMEDYRESVQIFTDLQLESAQSARIKLIANGKHDPEEYLLILRPAILAINTYTCQYSYDSEMVNKRDELFWFFSIFGDPQSTDDLVINFHLLNQSMQLCKRCGLPHIKGSHVCWNCGNTI